MSQLLSVRWLQGLAWPCDSVGMGMYSLFSMNLPMTKGKWNLAVLNKHSRLGSGKSLTFAKQRSILWNTQRNSKHYPSPHSWVQGGVGITEEKVPNHHLWCHSFKALHHSKVTAVSAKFHLLENMRVSSLETFELPVLPGLYSFYCQCLKMKSKKRGKREGNAMWRLK